MDIETAGVVSFGEQHHEIDHYAGGLVLCCHAEDGDVRLARPLLSLG